MARRRSRADELDSRFHIAASARGMANKVFPTHWSFMLGEIALWSFVVLLVSGVYLTLFFDPSMAEVVYDGAYQPLNGVMMTRAYESTLDLSFEVRGGLFVRQLHHWAALLFAASIVVHMLRIFFTGAFRRPREANWVIGCVILILAMFEGFFGYSLPDDLLSGTGVRAAMSGIVLGIPVIGTWVHWALFGGQFPGEVIIPRMYVLHILLVPGVLLALIGAHLALVWYQKHTQFPGAGRTEANVVGVRVLPVFALKAGAYFALTIGVLAIMAGIFQINPVWTLGPYHPAHVSAATQPDIYMMWTDGLLRLMPAWELYFGDYTVAMSNWVVLVMGAVFVVMTTYPWIEKRLSGDRAHHNLLQRPRDAPVRTAIGAMALAFYTVLTLSCMNDVIALRFHISLNAMTWAGRIGLLVVPPLAYAVAYRWALALQRSDRDVLEHGIETGIIRRLPHGAYIEVHQPLGPDHAGGDAMPLSYQGAPVPKHMNKLGAAGTAAAGSLLFPDPAHEQRRHRDNDRAHAEQQKAAVRALQHRDGRSTSRG
jgi:ubiquinol-cytochrome c reductase cytochrome b subunit